MQRTVLLPSLCTLLAGCGRVHFATSAPGGCDDASVRGPNPVTSGLVAYWPLDEGSGTIAVDQAGTYDGALDNGPIWQPTGNVIGGALRFDGVDDRLDMGDVLDVGTNDVSYALWLTTTSTIEGGIMGESPYDCDSYGLFMQNDGTLAFDLKDDFGACGLDRIPSTSAVNDGEWHFIAVSIDRSSGANLYVDGVLENTNASPGVATFSYGSSGFAFRIGDVGNDGNDLGPFNGAIDDARVYDRPLSAQEVSDLYQWGLNDCSP